MNKRIYEAAINLHKVLEEHSATRALKIVEQAIAEDETLQELFQIIHKSETEMNEKLEYLPLESKEIKALRRKLFTHKYNMDTQPIMKEYNRLYKEVSTLYNYVSRELSALLVTKKGKTCH